MEDHKNKIKVLRLIKKCETQPLTTRPSRSLFSENIFKDSYLQAITNINAEKNYRCVGFNQIKQFLNKSKKVQPKKHKTGLMSTSMKSYTIKSNQPQDTLMTKQQVLSILQDHSNYINSQNTSALTKTLDNTIQNKISAAKERKLNKKKRKINFAKNQKSNDRLNKYQQKVEQLEKFSLNQKKENIASSLWPKILRSSVDTITQIYKKDQQKFESIKRNGFKLKAQSKRKKQLQWIQAQKDTALFEFLQDNKYYESLRAKKFQQTIIARI